MIIKQIGTYLLLKVEVFKKQPNHIKIPVFLILFVILGNISAQYRFKKLKENSVIVCEKVTTVSELIRVGGTPSIELLITHKGKSEYISISISEGYFPIETRKLFLGKNILLALDSTDMNNKELIYNRATMNEYNVSVEQWNSCVDSIFRITDKD